MTTEYERHEFSFAWPDLKEESLGLLVQSMRTNGFDGSNPIVLYEGLILDGWHRYRASSRADVQPIFTEFNGTERQALNFVEMRNSSRRQLTMGQQATALRKIDLQRPEAARRSKEEVAALLGPGSMSTVIKAFKLIDQYPDAAEDVAKGRRKFKTAVREEVEGEYKSHATHATPTVNVKLLARITEAATIKNDNFKPVTSTKALTDAITLWCKAREEGKQLAIVDY